MTRRKSKPFSARALRSRLFIKKLDALTSDILEYQQKRNEKAPGSFKNQTTNQYRKYYEIWKCRTENHQYFENILQNCVLQKMRPLRTRVQFC